MEVELEDIIKGLQATNPAYSVIGFGAFCWDYTKDRAITSSEKYTPTPFKGFEVKGDGMTVLLQISGPFYDDQVTKKEAVNGDAKYALLAGEKHNALFGPCELHEYETFRLGQDIKRGAGGGIVNLGKALRAQSNLPFELVVIRGEGCIDDLVDGATNSYVNVPRQKDQGNLVFLEPKKRTIVRGTAPAYMGGRQVQPKTNPLTVVIDSLDSAELAGDAFSLYERLASDRKSTELLGVIAITPKMKGYYSDIETKAIKGGFIPIFSPTDAVNYAFTKYAKANEKDWRKQIIARPEENLTYTDVLLAAKEVWDQQGSEHQRIYVTLGEFGCIGVDKDGEVYRVDVFNVKATNKNGAGDAFASGIVAYEHETLKDGRRGMSNAGIVSAMAYATAVAGVHVSGNPATVKNISDLVSKNSLRYEYLGNIDDIGRAVLRYHNSLGKVGQGMLGANSKYTHAPGFGSITFRI
jgi:hypothetical protein